MMTTSNKTSIKMSETKDIKRRTRHSIMTKNNKSNLHIDNMDKINTFKYVLSSQCQKLCLKYIILQKTHIFFQIYKNSELDLTLLITQPGRLPLLSSCPQGPCPTAQQMQCKEHYIRYSMHNKDARFGGRARRWEAISKLPQPEKYELNAHDHLQEPTSGRKYSSKRYAYIYRNGAANSVTIKR